MSFVLSPSEIELLIHCHFSPEPHPRRDASAIRSAVIKFIDSGLIAGDVVENEVEDHPPLLDNKPEVYRTTPRGAAHIAQLCSIPLPEQAWIDGSGQVILEY